MIIKQQGGFIQVLAWLVFIVTLFFGLKPFNFISRNDICFDENAEGIQFNLSSVAKESHLRSIAYTEKSIEIPPYSSLSICLELAPACKPFGLGCIVVINDGQPQPPLIIAQWQHYLIIRSRRSEDPSRMPYQEHGAPNCFVSGETSRILVAYKSGETNIYLNEELVSQKKGFDLVERNLPMTGRIVFGSDGVVNGKSWVGAIKHFALYDEFIAPADQLNETSFPLIEYDFCNFQDWCVPNRQAETFDLRVPKYYKSLIFKRFDRLSSWEEHVAESKSDIIINIFGFMPFGFAVYILLQRRIRSRLILFLMTCLIAVFFSLIIESLQLFLPSRIPSQIDIVCNGLGGFVAACVANFFIFEKVAKIKRKGFIAKPKITCTN